MRLTYGVLSLIHYQALLVPHSIMVRRETIQVASFYTDRTYRHLSQNGRLLPFRVALGETDLFIKARTRAVDTAKALVADSRADIENYIATHPRFATTLTPMPFDETAPPIVKEMLAAASEAGVGPMAAVAGAIAESVGRGLLGDSPEVIVENGGDIFLCTMEPALIEIFAGPSPLSLTVGLKIDPRQMPLGVCTSSRSVGPSLSFGKADAVTILSPSAALADAVATAVGNVVKKHDDIQFGLKLAARFQGVHGALVIVHDRLGAWGELEVVKL